MVRKKVEIDFPTEDKFDFLAKRTDIGERRLHF